MTHIELSDRDAELFLLFQKHYQLFNTLEEKGIFKVSFGKCIMNIAFGEIQNIVKEEVVFKK